MVRKPNELLVTREVLEGMFQVGSASRGFRVDRGPESGARIIGARFEDGYVVLEYDRSVDEVLAVETGPGPWGEIKASI